MPPKPDKKKEDKKQQDEPEPDEEEKELLEKELIIGYLKSKLGRYQDVGEKLQLDNIRLLEELDNQKLNLRDINEFLTNELKARSLTTSALEEKVSDLQAHVEDIKKLFEGELSKVRGEKDREIEALENQIHEYERKMRVTQEFLERKDSLEEELASLRAGLDKTTKDYEQKLSDLERQQIQDREKWKRDMVAKIKETKQAMMKLTDNQLEITTKRTIMENEQMSNELAYQSRQVEKLLAKNTKLTEENAGLRRQLSLSCQTEEELAKRNYVYQKTIKTLLSKLKDQGDERAEEEAASSDLQFTLEELHSQLHLAKLQMQDKDRQVEELKGRLEESEQRLGAWQSSIDDTAKFLMQCMEDLRGQAETDQDEQAAGSLDDMTPQQRHHFLGELLSRLRRANSGSSEQTSPPPSAPAGTSGSALPPIVASTSSPRVPQPQRYSPGFGSAPLTADTWTSARPISGEDRRISMVSSGLHTAKNSLGMAGVEEMIGQVMSEVRPWGKRSGSLPLSNRNSGTFQKKSIKSASPVRIAVHQYP